MTWGTTLRTAFIATPADCSSIYHLDSPTDWKAPWPQSEPTPSSPTGYCESPDSGTLLDSSMIPTQIGTA